FRVIGGQLLCLEQIAEGLPQLPELVVREAELPYGTLIGGVDPEHVPVLEDRLLVLLLRRILVAALQMACLLGLRRPRAAGCDEQAENQENGPSPCSAKHLADSPRLSRAGKVLDWTRA